MELEYALASVRERILKRVWERREREVLVVPKGYGGLRDRDPCDGDLGVNVFQYVAYYLPLFIIFNRTSLSQ